jgi:hypothetical protein
MNDHLGPLPPLVWGPELPFGHNAARLTLWGYLIITGTGALWRAWEGAVRVVPERRVEFLWTFAAYPAALALLHALTLLSLERQRAAGAFGGAGLLAYHAARGVWLMSLGGGIQPTNETERLVAQAIQGALTILLVCGALVLARAGIIFMRASEPVLPRAAA